MEYQVCQGIQQFKTSIEATDIHHTQKPRKAREKSHSHRHSFAVIVIFQNFVYFVGIWHWENCRILGQFFRKGKEKREQVKGSILDQSDKHPENCKGCAMSPLIVTLNTTLAVLNCQKCPYFSPVLLRRSGPQ